MISTITTKELTIKKNDTTIIKNISTEFKRGKLYVILGENGAGKSTLLNALSLIEKSHGIINFDLESPKDWSKLKISQNISSIGQHDHAFLDCLVISRIAHGLVPWEGFNFKICSRIKSKIKKIANELDLLKLLYRPLISLSGGEKKRVHIARCLINNKASAYILDEPFNHLDIRHQLTVIKALQKRTLQNKIVIISSHNLNFIEKIANHIIVLKNGEKIFDHPSKDFLTTQNIANIYDIPKEYIDYLSYF